MAVVFENEILRALPWNERMSLEPLLESEYLAQGQILIQPSSPLQSAWFPEDAVLSRVMDAGSRSPEVGMIGREGFVGTALLTDTLAFPATTRVLIPGRTWRIRADDFRLSLSLHAGLAKLCRCFAHALYIQTASIAVTNATAPLEQRLARWLLMVDDRVGGKDITVSHEQIASLLGVRRPSVTVGLQILEGHGLLRATRKSIRIRDRQRLQAVAGELYGLAECEWERLMTLAHRPGTVVRESFKAAAFRAE